MSRWTLLGVRDTAIIAGLVLLQPGWVVIVMIAVVGILAQCLVPTPRRLPHPPGQAI